jgi:hypothetical protein
MRKERNLEEVGDGASARRLVKSFSTCLFSEQMSQVATTGAGSDVLTQRVWSSTKSGQAHF